MLDIQQTTLFDYTALDSETRAFVQEKAQSIHARLKRTAEDIIAIGQDLIEVKGRLQHGQFEAWLQSEFEMTQMSAVRFMQVAKRFGDKSNIMLDLPVTVLYALAAPSMPDTVIELVETGQIPATLPAIREAKLEARNGGVSFEQWQKDNLTLGLDAFGDPLPVEGKTETITPAQFIEEIQALAPDTPMHFPENFGKINVPEIQPRQYPDYVHPSERGLYDAFSEVVAREQIQQIQEQRRIEAKERIDLLREKGVSLPIGKFSCLVVDPPWHMQKIERDVRPNQVEFDYPTMSEEELQAFPLPALAADDCHLYLWTTQKFLPMALRLAEQWGFKYQCLLTWVKNVGFTPFSWMYSTEHVLFCRKGNLPLLKMGMRLDFRADVREHSRKPDEFYDLVKAVSPGPRLDVFSREKRDGFEQYGNEVEKFA